MKIDNFNDLKKLLKICRQEGVLAIKVDGMELSLSLAPVSKPEQFPDLQLPPEAGVKITNNIPWLATNPLDITATSKPAFTQELTEEQLLFYSTEDSHTQM